ncbi:DUF1572 family protein [Arcticibacterium luteifluviistationis]|uniref:DUF1572 domain-containing protein n=1 Tax=Arcticibacterium luteifluviistationis TaxID=1784714 RepID=A0A2Z4G8M7_9BACT|nr:DUF1572 family protein [Arcticibacterium luteifluviistationis]AWV97557.1 hypothetical protein DJ013_05005 [Arcticibacterium luteifluviistationis]
MEIIKLFRKQFENYKGLGDRTFAQISDEEILWKYNEESNSLAVIVKHMHGNMLSRWTDFLNTDGEKDWRDRDGEFQGAYANKEEMLCQWEAGWACLFKALDTVTAENINTPIYIRGEEHSVADAFMRQLGHYSSHVGQIMYIGRMIKGKDWKGLSVPKDGSKAFNKAMFSK